MVLPWQGKAGPFVIGNSPSDEIIVLFNQLRMYGKMPV